ncbi:type VII secretion integral membrane protein EccD [Rhodococcus aerolatus]
MTLTGTPPAGSPAATPGRRPAPAPGAPVFSRVTVLAPSTRVDVALPSDVAVADLLPVLLGMTRERTPDGGSGHGGWTLSRVGQGPLDPTATLATLGVLDGELLSLRPRADAAPQPLFDDVIDAVAGSAPDSYRPWSALIARAIGSTLAVAALLGAAAVVLAGPQGALRPGVALLVAVLATGVAGVLARVYRDPRSAVVLAGGVLPLAAVGGMTAVPGALGRPHLLLGSVAVVVLAVVALALTGSGVTTFTAATTAATLAAGASLVAVLVAHPTPGIGAGVAAVALALLSLAPRATILLARLPLPTVPITPDELSRDDSEELPDVVAIERQSALGHRFLSGLVLGLGATAAAGALLAAPDGWVGATFAVVVAGVLLLRARTYANGVQAGALLAAGSLTAAGILAGWAVSAPPEQRLLAVPAALLVVAAGALVLGVVVPTQHFSPVLRRAVELLEALLVTAVLPLALGVVGLYQTLRAL